MSHRLVMITWCDSLGVTSRWEFLDPKGKPKPLTIQSVGWIIRKGKRAVDLAGHLSEIDSDGDQQICGVMTIPTCAIESIKDLKG